MLLPALWDSCEIEFFVVHVQSTRKPRRLAWRKEKFLYVPQSYLFFPSYYTCTVIFYLSFVDANNLCARRTAAWRVEKVSCNPRPSSGPGKVSEEMRNDSVQLVVRITIIRIAMHAVNSRLIYSVLRSRWVASLLSLRSVLPTCMEHNTCDETPQVHN